MRRFETRIAIAALGASATAMAVARMFLGDAPEFDVASLPYPGSHAIALFMLLGIVAGLGGVAYNRTLLGAIATADRLERWPVELRAGLVGAGVGLLAWFAPGLVGGGEVPHESLARRSSGNGNPARRARACGSDWVPYRMPLARPAGCSPMLVLGAQLGLLFGHVCHFLCPGVDMPIVGFGVVGMAAFFTAVVRAPLTGIVLVIEMTGSFPMMLPMLGACFTAMLVPTWMGNAPIYVSLREIELRPGGRHVRRTCPRLTRHRSTGRMRSSFAARLRSNRWEGAERTMESSADNPGVAVLPPFLYGGVFLLVLALRWLWPLRMFERAATFWLGIVACVAAVALATLGATNDDRRGDECKSDAAGDGHRHVGTVSVHAQSAVRGVDAPVFGTDLGVQHVVGHHRARSGARDHAPRRDPPRGTIPRREIWRHLSAVSRLRAKICLDRA